MITKHMPQLRIGNLVMDNPIIQGGMGVGISLSGLASAVANEGGIGVISSVALGLLEENKQLKFKDANIHFLKKEIRKAKQQTDGVIGLNIMVAMSDYNNLLECAIEEEVDIVFLGAGLPLRFPKRYSMDEIKRIKTHFAPIVSSARAAQIVFQYWEKSFGRISALSFFLLPMKLSSTINILPRHPCIYIDSISARNCSTLFVRGLCPFKRVILQNSQLKGHPLEY